MGAPESQPQIRNYIPGQIVYIPNPELVPLYPTPLWPRPLFGFFIRLVTLVFVCWVTIKVIIPAALRVSIPWSRIDKDYDTHMVLPSDVKVNDCAGWETREEGWYNIIATTSLQLPVDSERLFFLRDGRVMDGSFTVVQGDSISDKIDVEVILTAKNDGLVDGTQVCFLSRETGGHGVGILAEYPRHWNNGVSVGIVVTLPQSPHGKLALKTFESHLPFIRQSLTLDDNVTFQKLDISGEFSTIAAEGIFADQVMLKTTNAAISGSIEASESLSISTTNAKISGKFTSPKSLDINTSNGPISGRFWSSDFISLSTENAHIDADVDLFHDGVSDEKVTTLKIRTTNGAIDGTINTTSLLPTGLGGSFNISAITTNGKNTLKFPTISPRANLSLTASTQAAAIAVELDEAYEGDFNVQTSRWEKVDVVVWRNPRVSDPEGRGRQRHVDLMRGGGGGGGERGAGRVWWGEGDGGKGKGKVDVRTSYGRATLVV
ncbi:hypothetical protein BDN72DRAFT_860812 [Pluteus cervinus]|uniref:Uncharacterized protein n=1 Tax=Pluteus cervinus TaxID=181527 RepID=A0ACD3AIX8_9AGAR|nr:hypothetical protein BDN72DRAFT_860812 [Pluteus cervinus]